MFVIIAGGGRTGAQLASYLIAQKHKVHLVEDRTDVLARIHQELPTEAIYQGDPTSPHMLELAGRGAGPWTGRSAPAGRGQPGRAPDRRGPWQSAA